MIALLFLVLSLAFGNGILRKVSLKLHFFEFLSASFVVGTVISVWLIFLVTLFLEMNMSMYVGMTLITGATLLLWQGKKQSVPLPHFSRFEIITYLVFTLAWSAILLPLFISHNFYQKTDGLYSGGGAWGDLALHSTFIQKFTQQPKLNLTSPIYSAEKTTYPFLFDFYTALFVQSGHTLQASLVITSFLFTMAFLQLAYFFIIRISSSHGGAALFTFLFLFNGGVGVWHAYQDFMKSGKTLLSFLSTMNVEYAHLAVYKIHWSNIIADYLLPQRAFLAGLPIFVLILMTLRSLWVARSTHADQRFFVVILIGLLPLFHTHTFLAAIGFLVFFIACEYLLHKRSLLSWLLPFLLLCALAIPQLFWQLSHTFGHGFMRIQYGWKKGDESIVLFWLRNMGMEALLFGIAGAYTLLFERRKHFVHMMFVAFTLLFVITNIVIFQPHDYDNMKLMIYSHFVFTVVSTIALIALWKKNVFAKALTLFLCVSLTITGVLSVIRESYTSWRIATNGDIQIASHIKEKTNPYGIFLTADSHNHPVTMLAGRSTIMGYRGWLWTHGIDYKQTERDVVAMFAGTQETPVLLKKYQVSYVYIGDAERDSFHANEEYFQSHYNVVYQNESGTVYDIMSPPPLFAKE